MDKNRYFFYLYSISGLVSGLGGTVYASQAVDFHEILTAGTLFTTIDQEQLFYGLFLNAFAVLLLLLGIKTKFEGEIEDEKRNT